MAAQSLSPSNQKMTREFSTPNHRDGFFSEIVARTSPRYTANYPIKRGTPYATLTGGETTTRDSFNPLYFLKEVRAGTSDELVIWFWATDQNAQDVANAVVTYSGEAITAPIYARVYTIRRDVYDATPTLAEGSALTALLGVKVTAGGTGYARTDTVSISGGGGATAELVVNETGVIQNIIVTNCGSGYDSASLPAVTITTTTGSGATLVAIVQPKTALLVHQEKQELGHDSTFTNQSTDSPLSSEYVRVIRIYETLPGPTIYTTRVDDDGAVVTIGKTRKAPSAITSGETLVATAWTITVKEDTDNKNVAVEVTTAREIPGTTISDAPEVDQEMNAVITVAKTRKAASSITPQAVVSGTNLIVTTKQAITALVAWEIVKTIPLPAAQSEGTAVISSEFKAYTFPGRLDVALLDLYGTAIGYAQPKAEETQWNIYTYWAVSDTKPTASFEEIITDTIVINDVTYPNVLHDATSRLYNGYLVNIPATTPSYTTYKNSWVGQYKTMGGNIVPTRYQKLWKIELYKVKMR